MRKRRRKQTKQARIDRAHPRPEPRLPSELQTQLGEVSAELGRRELLARRWRAAFEYAESATTTAPGEAAAVMAEAAARQARRSALNGDFGSAQVWAERAVQFRPQNAAYQERLRLIRAAAAAALAGTDARFFPGTVGASTGKWWELDLLPVVRGWDGSRATVAAPILLEEISRETVEDVYALGIYQPWHVAGPTPLFTQYIRELKPHGTTVSLAAILLRQGLVLETDWLEEIEVIVPVPTGLRSFEERGFELTEQLAAELSQRMCIPLVDVFERDPDAEKTHRLGDYSQRVQALTAELRTKRVRSAALSSAEAVLVVDDVVTYGATFEACAQLLKAAYPNVRVYGAALAYTETPQRRARAEAERAESTRSGSSAT